MHRARPPRWEAYAERPQDYRCACCVWTVLVAGSAIFLLARTVELKLRLSNSERVVSHFASRAFPIPMLDICELDDPHRLSVLDKFSVDLHEAWGSTDQAEVLRSHKSVSKKHGVIPHIFTDETDADDDKKPAYKHLLPTSMRDPIERESVASEDENGYRCVRFNAGNQSVEQNTIWYEAEFVIRLNLSTDDVAERASSIISWNDVTVMTDHFFRVSLSDDTKKDSNSFASPLMGKIESLRMAMLPFQHPHLKPEESGFRELKAVGRPTFHKWTDSVGGRFGAPESDKALFERSEFEGEPPYLHEGDPGLSILLDIPSCKSLLSLHINDVYSDILAWMTSVLAQFAIFNVMAFLFIPVHDVVGPTRFRFECCGLGLRASSDEKRPLLDQEQIANDAGQQEAMDGFDA